jgi:hypothetical protein
MESTIAALEALAQDSDVQTLITQKRAQLEVIRGKLHAARPLRTQMRAAEEARDRAVKKHSLLNEEIIGLRLILDGKAAELATAAEDVKKASQYVVEVQSRMTAADLLQLQPPPQPMKAVPYLTPVELAAQLATHPDLDAGTRASFETWMANVPAGAVAVPVFSIASDQEMTTRPSDQGNQAEADAYSLLDGHAGADGAGPPSAPHRARIEPPVVGAFRTSRARSDPYQRPKRRTVKAEAAEESDVEGERSRSENENLSALGSCRSAATGAASVGLGGRAGGSSGAP